MNDRTLSPDNYLNLTDPSNIPLLPGLQRNALSRCRATIDSRRKYTYHDTNLTINYSFNMSERLERNIPLEAGPKGRIDIPKWVNARPIRRRDGEGVEYGDIAVELAPKPIERTFDEILGSTPETVDANAEQAMKVLDGLYEYFKRISSLWMQDDGNQRFPEPLNWYDAAARAAMAGILSAREVIHVAAAYKDGHAPYTDAGDKLSFTQANGNAQEAFSKAWEKMGLPPLSTEQPRS